ncbi:MAG: ATP synthase subunit I [Lysobacteraceae bacterium]
MNPVETGRRSGYQLAAMQALVAVCVAAAFLAQGRQAAIGALFSGLVVALGSVLVAWRATAGGVQAAGSVLVRLASALLIKWVLIGVAMYFAFAHLELPPLPVLAGLCAGLVLLPFFIGLKS